MEPNDSNMKTQPTGGLKLMTVFIAVLALHVVVIGGFTVWHLLYPSSVENDLAADKAHKNSKMVSDSSITEMSSGTDTSSPDKTPGAAAAAAAEGEAPAASDASATASAAPTVQAAPAAAQPPVVVTPPPAEDTSTVAANPPANGPVRNGPVVNPPSTLASSPEPTAASVAADAIAPAPSATPADGTSYTVKKGDSLARIAHRHHVTVSNLRAANGLAGDGLHIGQKLTIPEKAPKATAVAASEAPAAPAPVSSAPVAQPVQDADMTGMAPTGASTTDALPKHATHKLAGAAAHRSYTVVKGDTLTKIAKRYHTTTSAIMAANNLTNAGRLSIGQKLHIPSREARASATADGATPQEPETHSTAKGQFANYTP
jgi:LysM repeat protein